jgi:hypothetical protein
VIYIEPNLYIRVQELPNGPAPLPLRSGFNTETAYRVLGIFSASESSECFFVLGNDRDETWFVSNRHFRIVGVFPEARGALRFALEDAKQPALLSPGAPSPLHSPLQAPAL